MNKHFRIVDVNGFRGLMLFLFILVCLACGFIAFPGFVAMTLWNMLSASVALPEINLFQGILLWAIIAFAIYIWQMILKDMHTFHILLNYNLTKNIMVLKIKSY